MNWKTMASMLHTQRLKMYLASGMKQKEALKQAYKDVGEELKLLLSDSFDPVPDKIDSMEKEFQERKKNIEERYESGRMSKEQKAMEKKQVWEEVHRKYGTQKKKSVNFENYHRIQQI